MNRKKKSKNRKEALSERYAWQDHKTRRIHSDDMKVKSVCAHLNDQDALEKLVELVETGKGFVLSDTAEYMEGLNSLTHPALLSKIHNGQFSIQDYIDLHGRGVEDANHLFHQFIKRSISTGKNCVLIVHGRGLSSPNGPVLKEKIKYWLTKGPLRKWIVAFASARAVDGGTGATCVLLRHTPLTKRYRKKIAALI